MTFTWYIFISNIVGCIAYGLRTFLSSQKENKAVDIIMAIIVLLGGSFGALLALLLFDRHAKKSSMMLHVFIVCVVVIQVISYLLFIQTNTKPLDFAFWTYFSQHKWLLYNVIGINVVTYIAFARDKYAAMKHRKRISIMTLLGFTFIGGSIGGLFAMYSLRHKTQKDYFTLGVPLILVMQVVVILFVMNLS